jgi:hypothetical protein
MSKQEALHDPFVRLTKRETGPAGHYSSPLFLRPEAIKEIENGKVHVEGGGFHHVAETAEKVRDLVAAKMAENRQAEALGK